MKLTDAQQQAYTLHAVAQHLWRHDSLSPVYVDCYRPAGRTRLQTWTKGLDGLLPWAGSLPTEVLHVRRIQDADTRRVYLHAHGQLTGMISVGHRYIIAVDVWSATDELNDGPLDDGDTVAVADLVVAATDHDPVAALAAVQGGDRP